MVKKFFKKANSLFLAAAMTVTLMPAQMTSAAGTDAASDAAILQQTDIRTADTSVSALDVASITGKEYTVIEGNVPVFPKKANVTSDDGTMVPAEIQWADWDASLGVGTHNVTGTAGGTQIKVTVNVLPCDEAVPDVQAMGRSEDTAQEKLDAIHPLRGYKGLFVAEYDIVPNDEKSTHDRAVIYLPAADSDGGAFNSESCWDYGARLQFKYNYGDLTYFQTQIGDGKNKDNAVYYPTNDELKAELDDKGETDKALLFDKVSTYHVRTVMDTASDTTKGNVKIYITDPEGIEHEVTQPGGNGFRIYPTNGVVKNFAAIRGSYRLVNHKISWISGYATKKTEIYLKAQNAADYVKDSEDIITKEVPGAISGQPDDEIVRNNQSYTLDEDKSGWYNGEEKVPSVTAQENETVTYRAYYNYAKAIDKTSLAGKVQAAQNLSEEDYTATSWNALKDALADAKQANEDTTASQTAVDGAEQALDKAEENLVSIKKLKEAVGSLEAELEAKEAQKEDYVNWNEVERALNSAKTVMNRPSATKIQVENAEASLSNIRLITKSEQELTTAKEEMESSVASAEQKIAEVKENDYTPASWNALKEALEACKNLNAETAAKADYDTKKEALDRAVAGLTKLADKTALNQAIATAESKKKADYETASYNKMQEQLAAAKAVAGNPNATQSEVDTVKTTLLDLVSKLKPASVQVTSVKPAAKTYKIAAGKKLDLKKVFTVLPSNASNKKLTYSLDKKYSKYASLKSGVVTVKKKGAGKTVVVKAAAADGSGKNATIKIKIMKNAVTKITVKKKSLTVKAGKKVTIKPVVKTNGKSVNKTLAYTSSNEKLATVKNGVVTTKKGKAGKVTITIKSTDGTNKSVKVTVKIKK